MQCHDLLSVSNNWVGFVGYIFFMIGIFVISFVVKIDKIQTVIRIVAGVGFLFPSVGMLLPCL